MRMVMVPFILLTAACHGIQPTPTSPAPPARSQTVAALTIVPSPGELPIGGGSALIIVEALGADRLGVTAPVTLASSAGELATTTVTTDRTGHATAAWQGTASTTITATAGDVTAVRTLKVNTPIDLPPPSVPPPPIPQPEPTPLPTPPPSLSVSVTAAPSSIPAGGSTTLSATVGNLLPGEFVTAYQWDYEGDKTVDETSVSPSRSHVYPTDGIIAPTVRVLTSANRSASGAGQVVVFKPLRGQ